MALQPGVVQENSKDKSSTKTEPNIPLNRERYYKTEKQLLREKVFRKYNSRCYDCGSLDKLHMHHILEVQYGGKDDIDNLILLCEKCHQKRHGREFSYARDGERRSSNNEKLQSLRYVINNRKTISIVYEKQDGSITVREIAPNNIYEEDNRLYVQAYCYLRNERRTFRVSRIKELY